MSTRRWLAALLLSTWSISALALEDQSVLLVSWVKPRPGMEQQFETGLTAHHKWRREAGETWRWIVWRIGSGEQSGVYAVGTFNHQWADFENPPVDRVAARKNWYELVDPFVESAIVHHYSYQKSLNTRRDDQPPRKFSVTTEFELIPGREGEFVDAAARIREAIVQTGLAYHYEWYRLETGGARPLYARVRLLWHWEELNTDDASVEAAVLETFGERRGKAIIAQFHAAVRSETNRYAELRPAMFLIPDTSD